MLMGIDVDTSEAERAMLELYRESDRDFTQILLFNAIDLTKSLAFHTPKKSGVMRAGWWPAWRALNIPGSPGTRRPFGETQVGRGKRKKTYVADGHFIDGRGDPDDAKLEIVNTTHMILRTGERLDYPWSKSKKGTCPAELTMAGANQEVSFKWHGRLQKAMRKRSAR